MCIGTSSCPTDLPATGSACSSLNGVVCDYPNANPAFHMGCVCSGDADAGSGLLWTCIQSASCPATQPRYDVSGSCPGTGVCTYSTAPNHCLCLQAGTPWICF
jgi:hypothetical protein